jgi:hypothetical protein
MGKTFAQNLGNRTGDQCLVRGHDKNINNIIRTVHVGVAFVLRLEYVAWFPPVGTSRPYQQIGINNRGDAQCRKFPQPVNQPSSGTGAWKLK